MMVGFVVPSKLLANSRYLACVGEWSIAVTYIEDSVDDLARPTMIARGNSEKESEASGKGR